MNVQVFSLESIQFIDKTKIKGHEHDNLYEREYRRIESRVLLKIWMKDSLWKADWVLFCADVVQLFQTSVGGWWCSRS